MKRMKRIMALMLATIMMMAMSVTAFAAEGAGTHKLTVNVKTGTGVPTQTLKDQTIYLYKTLYLIFDYPYKYYTFKHFEV